jgi:YHS domain-containing protein
MKRVVASFVIVALAASLGVAAYPADPAAAAINDKCPVSGEKVGKETMEVKVSFCCGNCKGKFDKDPVASLNKMDKFPNDKCPVAGKPVKDATSTVTIAFCCDDCKGKFEKEPGKYLSKLKAAEKK